MGIQTRMEGSMRILNLQSPTRIPDRMNMLLEMAMQDLVSFGTFCWGPSMCEKGIQCGPCFGRTYSLAEEDGYSELSTSLA